MYLLAILLETGAADTLGPLIFLGVIVFMFLGIFSSWYYDGFSDEPVKIKGKLLRLGNHYNKFVIEKFYFPGIWLQVLNKPFIVPLYVTEVTDDMRCEKNTNGEETKRLTYFPDTDDREVAEEAFNRINSYTSKEKFKKYIKAKQQEEEESNQPKKKKKNSK